jgi:kynurenine formamidase
MPLLLSRRQLLGTWTSLAIGSTLSTAIGCSAIRVPSPAKVTRPLLRTDEDIERLLPRLTNWGRWGADDQKGTLNLLTPAKRRAAAALVRSGRAVSLARELSLTRTEGLKRGVHDVRTAPAEGPNYPTWVSEAIGLAFHGFTVTHVDALSHTSRDGQMYNGHPASAVTETGAGKLGIQVVASEGIVGRGVLLDVARTRSAPIEPGAALFPEDLELAEATHGVRVEEGDLLVVRTGLGRRNTRELRAGLHADCLPWLHERGVALLCSDGDNDIAPVPFQRWYSPIHTVGIQYMGLWLLDNADLEPLSRACVEENRWEFLLSMGVLPFQGVTGSPLNPIALL